MKKVHNTQSVMALWADKLQSEARNPSRNVFFDGDTIYSYGLHFPMGKHVDTKNGPAILITLATYSKTTAKHITQLTNMLASGVVVFRVYDLGATPFQQFLGYAERQGGMLAAWRKARGNKSRIRQAMRELISEANHFAKAFGLSLRIVLPAELQEADNAEMKAGLEARATARVSASLLWCGPAIPSDHGASHPCVQ
jgi:hypothetical protein